MGSADLIQIQRQSIEVPPTCTTKLALFDLHSGFKVSIVRYRGNSGHKNDQTEKVTTSTVKVGLCGRTTV